ncbi:discoidin domain-containing protein, partial [Klebsiella pneumoniae]|nr:discoidin domain-containing protein [Klebsiella pneumoniae]
MAVSGEKDDPWRKPAWMLLSVGKAVSASSSLPEHRPERAVEENVQTWWRAASNSREEWLQLDLGKVYRIHAVQLNFADDKL